MLHFRFIVSIVRIVLKENSCLAGLLFKAEAIYGSKKMRSEPDGRPLYLRVENRYLRAAGAYSPLARSSRISAVGGVAVIVAATASIAVRFAWAFTPV